MGFHCGENRVSSQNHMDCLRAYNWTYFGLSCHHCRGRLIIKKCCIVSDVIFTESRLAPCVLTTLSLISDRDYLTNLFQTIVCTGDFVHSLKTAATFSSLAVHVEFMWKLRIYVGMNHIMHYPIVVFLECEQWFTSESLCLFFVCLFFFHYWLICSMSLKTSFITGWSTHIKLIIWI